MNEHSLAEQEALDRLEETWKRQGYQVIREPRKSDLPSFLGSIRPDALLIGKNHNVVVEVIRKGNPHATRKVREYKQLIEGNEGWKFEVVYTGAETKKIERYSIADFHAELGRIEIVARTDTRAALILLWGLLEAVARHLEPQAAAKPQTPGRVVELLASGGYVSATDAASLRTSLKHRNRIAHGDLSNLVEERRIVEGISIAKRIISRLAARNSE